MRENESFFLESADCLSANFQPNFFTIYDDGLGLEVRGPHFFSVPLREANVIAVLLAFTSNIT